LTHETRDVDPFICFIASYSQVLSAATARNQKGLIVFYYHILIVHDIIIPDTVGQKLSYP